MVNNQLILSNLSDDDINNQNIFLALINVLFCIVSTILALISLSVIPECIGKICTQFLTFFVTQVIVHIAFLIVSIICVAYLLGILFFLYFLILKFNLIK